MDNTLALHPGLLARAWLNVYPASKLSEEYEKAVIVEQHSTGVWLVAIAPTVIAASWVPSDPAYVDSLPDLGEAPIAQPVVVGDADGRVTALMKYQWGLWKRSPLDAGFDDYITVGPTTPPEDDKSTLPGLERRAVRFRTCTEHVDTIETDKPVASWRTMMRIVTGGQRSQCTLPMESLKALADVEGCADPKVEFAVGAGALLRFEPLTGDRPYVLAYIPVGKRDDDTTAPNVGLVQQVYDEDTATYQDDDLAGQVAQSVLAGVR